MKRKIIIGVVIIAALGFVIVRLASNKAKINKEASYKEVIENVPVNVMTAQTATLNSELAVIGLFQASKESSVSAEIAGKIISVNVNEGDFVTEGQIIAELDQTSLSLKLEADEAQYAHSKEELERYENLNKKEATTDLILKQMRLTNSLNEIAVKTTKEQIAKSKIKAPITGYLTSKNFEEGTIVSPGQPIGQVANITTLKFNAMVPEYQVIKFNLDQEVNVNADVFPDAKFIGTITQIAEKGDDNHHYKIVVTVNNNNKLYPLRAGMNGTMRVADRNSVTGIFVISAALVGTTENPQIYIADGNKAVLKNVVTGAAVNDSIQITQGLNDGDKVIITGMNNLKDGRSIKIAN